jgi:cell division transport system permease protein
MKLVGASWGFIRMPFLKRACGVGLVAAVLACGALGGLVYAAYHYHVGFDEVLGLRELLITGAVVLFFGLFITLLCSYISVNQFLKMKAGELYKI